MTTGGSTTWAVIVILVIPAAIVAASELDERLRQRESVLRGAVATLRTWALPFFALWALLVPVIGVDSNSIAVRLVASGLVLAIAGAGLGVVRVAIDDLRRRVAAGERRSVPELLLALPRIAVIVTTAWILIDSVWGVDLSAALTALGVTSLVVSFALQDTLSGLASGILLLSDRPFQPGDWISTADIEGEVVDINWRTSRIRDRDGDILIVPNSQLAGSTVVNHSAPDPRTRIEVELTVAYKNPPTLVKEMLLSAARATDGVIHDPAPRVMITTIDDPLMGYKVQLWVDDFADVPRVKSDFSALVWYHSHRHDVPLPSPAQDLYLYDAATTPGDRDFSDADIRRGVEASPLLALLPEVEIDRVVRAAVPVRYARGELIRDSRVASRDLLLLTEGRAELVLLRAGEPEAVVTALDEGEVLGLMTAEGTLGGRLVARAVADCELLQIGAELAAELGGRHPEISDALNRTTAIRQRRIDRIVELRAIQHAAEQAGGANSVGGDS